MRPWCFSGGAKGADYLFGRCAEKVGHTVIHYSFEGHKAFAKTNLVVLTDDELREADPYLKMANKQLKRSFPARYDDTNNLLRRNYWQVKNTHQVYAVAPLDEQGKILGGTAWAVQMAINMSVPVYVFDLNTNEWYSYDFELNRWLACTGWRKLAPAANFPGRKYTGIGSRDLTPQGERAILDLYGLQSIS